MSEIRVIDLFLDDEDVRVGTAVGQAAGKALGVGPCAEIADSHFEIGADVAAISLNAGITLHETGGNGFRLGAGRAVAVKKDADTVSLHLGAAVGNDVPREGVPQFDGLVD